jgi:hypothetical protein
LGSDVQMTRIFLSRSLIVRRKRSSRKKIYDQVFVFFFKKIGILSISPPQIHTHTHTHKHTFLNESYTWNL